MRTIKAAVTGYLETQEVDFDRTRVEICIAGHSTVPITTTREWVALADLNEQLAFVGRGSLKMKLNDDVYQVEMSKGQVLQAYSIQITGKKARKTSAEKREAA